MQIEINLQCFAVDKNIVKLIFKNPSDSSELKSKEVIDIIKLWG